MGDAKSGRRACARSAVWLLPAAVDWHWQLPAVTLPFIVLVGALVADSDLTAEPGPLEVELRDLAGPDELEDRPLSVHS